MVQEPEEHQVSILWAGLHQVYRFALGSIAGGNIKSSVVTHFHLSVFFSIPTFHVQVRSTQCTT